MNAPGQGAGTRRLMALDYGLGKIGVAVGDEASGSVQPVGVVRVRRSRPLWNEMDKQVKCWQPQLFLVGLPLMMDGSSSDMASLARSFAGTLAERYGLPFEMSDERLSTATARELWDGKNKEELQGLSAAVILTDWLQRALADG